MSRYECRVEIIDESHIMQHAALSRAEYGETALSDPQHLRWKYLQNSNGRAHGIHVFADGEMIARLVALPSSFVTASNVVRVAYMVDMLVHPAHRGMAVLMQIAQGYHCLRDYFDMALVTPNESGLAVWEKFFKLQLKFGLGVHAIPLRPVHAGRSLWPWTPGPVSRRVDYACAFLFRIVSKVWTNLEKRFQLVNHWPVDDEIDKFLTRCDELRPGAHGQRTAAFLKWRFRHSPIFQYYPHFVYRGDKIAGYLVTRRTDYMGLDTLFIVDALGPGLTTRDWRYCVADVVANIENAPAIIALLGNTKTGAIGAMARTFLQVPPSRLPFGPTLLADWWSSPAFPIDAKSLELTLADCDMI